jgi:hypothetical protein
MPLPRPPQSPAPHLATLALALLLAACEGSREAPQELPPLPPPVTRALEPPGSPHPTVELGITLVGEVRGEIDPCGCPTLPMGGFERRAGLMDELKAESPPLFHLDAGNMLVEGYATGGRGDVRDRAELLLDLSAEVGLDAFCPGPADLLVLEPAQLRRELSARGVDAVSATWRAPDGSPLLPAATVIDRGGVRLGVIGLSAQPGAPSWRERIRFADPVIAAQEAVDQLPDDLNLVVALSNLSDDENNRVASQVEALAAILSVRNDAFDEPRKREQALVIEVPNRGRYVSLVRVRAAAEPGRSLDLEAATALQLETHDHIAAKKARLEARGEQLSALEQERLEEHRALLGEEGAGRNLAYVETYPLGSRYQGDLATAERIDAFKAQVLDLEIAARSLERARPAGPPRYVTSARCATCHMSQYSRWALTGHTRGQESLLERGEERNPECLSCHATGFAVEGGWAELSPANLLVFKAVQCEACHGPAEAHLADSSVHPSIPTMATCLRCHDHDNSPGFDYDTYLPRAVCTAPPYTPPPAEGTGAASSQQGAP